MSFSKTGAAARLRLAGPLLAARAERTGTDGFLVVRLDRARVLVNPGLAGLGSDVRLSSLAVLLVDSTGAIVRYPSRVLSHVGVRVGAQLFVDRPVSVSEDSSLSLAFSSLLSIPAQIPTAERKLATCQLDSEQALIAAPPVENKRAAASTSSRATSSLPT